MRKRSLAVLLLSPIVALSCRAATRAPITLGAAGPWTQDYGAMNRRGIELALTEINARPERRGQPIRVLFRDDQGDGIRASQIAQEFVNNAQVVAVIGHVNSGAMVSAARLYDGGRLPAVATTASSPTLSGVSPWTFRVISSDSMNGLAIARFAMRLGKRRAAVLYENNAYGRGLTDAFQRGFKGEIISADPIAEGPRQNFEPYVTYFMRQRPEIVFVAGTGESGFAFLREARRQGLPAELVGADGWSVLTSDTANAEGVLVGAPFSAEDTRPEAKLFVRRFEARYGITPDGNAALAYDATMVIAEAVQRAGADRAHVRDFLASLAARGGFKGATGVIRFNAAGDPIGKSVVMTRIRRGALIVENGQ